MLAALRSRFFLSTSPSSSFIHRSWKLGFSGSSHTFFSSTVESSSSNKGLLDINEVENVLKDVRADDVKVIPVGKHCDWADYMVVATGRSTWHVKNIAQALIYKAKEKQRGAQRMMLPSLEGQEGGKWIVIDSGKVIIHALDEKARAYYNLEDLWTSGMPPKEPVQYVSFAVNEILARVASSSVTDLINAKACCKEFREAASEDYVFEHATIDSFPVIPWKINHGASSFLERCKKSGNPEALFRQGMIDYFSTLKYDSGLKFLEKAASKGHAEAIYVYGMILMCYGGDLRNNGVKLLSDLKRSKSSLFMTECRKKVKRIVWSMWVNNYIIGIGPAEEEEYTNRRPCTHHNTKALCSFTASQTKIEQDGHLLWKILKMTLFHVILVCGN
ncbi:hypothetical protein GH714_017539 [Hevea brasiliensis]|uniref:At2g35280-like TPR domain-containing protein n=1 Tax=Hevea brasiliensis TaxID=3981 RepID=A0A6A6KCF6_HEVBR|nr:hypothetical protein GH714_017539 [Hevea brasiliensis]